MVFYADALYLFDLERVVGASVECGFRLYPQQEGNADNESWYRSPGVNGAAFLPGILEPSNVVRIGGKTTALMSRVFCSLSPWVAWPVRFMSSDRPRKQSQYRVTINWGGCIGFMRWL